jgi:hypothetical protein
MILRHAVLILPLLVLFGCADRQMLTAPEAPLADIVPQSVVHVVQNLNDSGPGSLREAISSAGNGHVVTFDATLAGGTIVLGFELFIDKSLTIAGPAGGITISGNDATRVFRVGNLNEVVLDNLSITHGNPSINPFDQVGGAILSSGNLVIRNSTVANSWAPLSGGGIEHQGGSLTILNSTISNNGRNPVTGELTSFSGGLRVLFATAAIVNSTISGNSAAGQGGGIVNNRSTLTLIHSTIADNGANQGGGILNFGTPDDHAVTELVNTIVARNSAGGVGNGPDIHNVSSGSADPEAFVELSASHSLVGSGTGHQLASDGDNLIGVDPRFELDGFGKPKLADNGGPTKTHALLADSPAIDAAAAARCTPEPVNGRDQRGVVRPQGGGCDIGALELTGVAPPQPPPPSVTEVSITASGTVNKTTGAAIISGSITCSTPGTVQLGVALRQEQKQRSITRTVVGSATFSVSCSGATAWAVAVTGSNGVFLNGSAHAAVETLNAAAPVAASRSVQLFWSK